jgi:hypothetical protein
MHGGGTDHMNITSFNPLILSKDAKDIVRLFEEMGFEKRHNKTGADFSSNRMRHEGGFHVDVVEAATPQDITTIRMNVSDFDEAYNMLAARGFKGTEGSEGRDTGTSRSAMMISPTGFSITIVKHIKK